MKSDHGNILLLTSENELQRLLDNAVEATLSRALDDFTVPSRSESSKEVLSNREAMQYLDLSKSTLQRYRDKGKLPYSKVGGKIYYERAELLRAVREQRVGRADQGRFQG